MWLASLSPPSVMRLQMSSRRKIFREMLLLYEVGLECVLFVFGYATSECGLT